MTDFKDSAAAAAGGQVGGWAMSRFIPYTKAKKHLASRLGASAEEIAAWVSMGPVPMAKSCRIKDSVPAMEDQLCTFHYWPCLPLEGLAAYTNGNEFDEPPRFHFDWEDHGNDYLRPLRSCWFRAEDIAAFQPLSRYITGLALRERWQSLGDVDGFISERIKESSLLDIHPTAGATKWSIEQSSDATFQNAPSKKSALFVLAHIEAIEAVHGASPAPVPATDTGELANMPETAADDDSDLAALFDPVKLVELEAMFPDEKWPVYAERAARNRLRDAARTERGLFNPYKAARWWLTTGPDNWDWKKCIRKLANNLPDRSIDSKNLLTGDYD